MLIKEALWYKDQIRRFKHEDIFPMLNVGSSTARFRKKSQPWINLYVFEPIKKEKVIHLDLKKEQGINSVGDITSPKFIKKLVKLQFKSIICANLLEHLKPKKRGLACRNLAFILPPGGYLFISCPYRYPLHYDPIATGYRPRAKELAANFPGTEMIKGEIIADFNYFYYLINNKTMALKILIRLLSPFYKYQEWQTLFNHLPWLFKKFAASCVLLKKTNQ